MSPAANVSHPSIETFLHKRAPAPLEHLYCDLLDARRVSLCVKREDLTHPHINGNKWHKLKLNLVEARQQQCHTLLTFGGAWSNHIHAVAAAGETFGFNTIGIIRGDEIASNSNLEFAHNCGMRLHYMDRKSYRNKNQAELIAALREQYGDFYLLPEGGSNKLAARGCTTLVDDIEQPFDVITTACGTGGTLAGIVSALKPNQQAIGYAVLKNADFLNDDVIQLLDDTPQCDWKIELDYHFGGYAKTNAELFEFMHAFREQFDIELDTVYTAKMFYGLFEDIRNKRFSPGTRIIAIHSGGLQANEGFKSLSNAVSYSSASSSCFFSC